MESWAYVPADESTNLPFHLPTLTFQVTCYCGKYYHQGKFSKAVFGLSYDNQVTLVWSSKQRIWLAQKVWQNNKKWLMFTL